jgi:hypothetical protein
VTWLVLLRKSGQAVGRFTIEAQYGDWHRGPITDTSREIITIAHRI